MCAQVTAAEAISTQWTHAVYEKAGDKQSASNFLSVFGPGCCGSMDKVRFNDGSTMCIAASDWQNAAECLPVAGLLLARANRAKWTDVTCAELASTPGDTAAGMSMKASLESIGTKCCGSLAKTRSQPACATGTQAPTPAPTPAPPPNMCKMASDLQQGGSVQWIKTSTATSCATISAKLLDETYV